MTDNPVTDNAATDNAATDIQTQVEQVWLDLLDVPAVAADENFFDAGGDSVLLIILLERLNAMTTHELEPPDLFRHSTIRAQAELLADPERPQATRVTENNRGALLGRAQRGQGS